MYRVAADTNDVELREVPLGEGFSLPVEALLAAADERTKLLWLCSPNNPTGNAFPEGEIERLLAGFDGMVVLDEAYIDFADGPGFLPRLAEFPNLIVLQTCSKAWGMAGLRLGLAFASEPVAELFARVKYPYNINTLAQEAASERLAWDIAGQTALIRRERAAVAEALAGAACIERVYPSEANFLLVRTPDPDRLYDTLIGAGIIVRNRSRIPCWASASGCNSCAFRARRATPAAWASSRHGCGGCPPPRRTADGSRSPTWAGTRSPACGRRCSTGWTRGRMSITYTRSPRNPARRPSP